MLDSTLVSIIIPTCNRSSELSECLNAVKISFCLTSVKAEVIVCDDSIQQSSQDHELGSLFIRYTQGPQRGPAANRNHGASLARGEWLLFCDDDCIPSPEWLGSYVQSMMGPENILEGCTLPKGKKASLDQECPANYSGGYLWSCNFAIRKVIFDRLSGFDENFPAPALEDVDLRIRLLKGMEKIKFIPSAISYHPWRPKRGFDHIDIDVASTCYLAKKHQMQLELFSRKLLVINFLRYILKTWLPGVFAFKGLGALRDLRLQLYNFYKRFSQSGLQLKQIP
jgi:GT2 family glycosyltransferase